ncbi:unnamed protein product [Sphagnum balticum]
MDAKYYRTKRRGITHGMEIAADVRTELEDIAERMLYHFLIVLVEDFPDPYDNHTWEGQVMMAGSTLFGYIMSGIWFTLPIELSLCIDESTNKVGMVIVCPDELLEEFEIVLENNSDLEVAPEPEGNWWYAPLIRLTGLPRSGKNTVANYLCAYHEYSQFAFADPLKEAAAILLNRSIDECNGIEYDREQVMPGWGFSMRWFLQRFGTECLRNQIHQDFWVMHMLNTLENHKGLKVGDKFVITDCRFPNEAAMIREMGGNVIEVRRDGTSGSDHVSDKGIAPDGVIYNNGTFEDLRLKVDKLTNAI